MTRRNHLVALAGVAIGVLSLGWPAGTHAADTATPAATDVPLSGAPLSGAPVAGEPAPNRTLSPAPPAAASDTNDLEEIPWDYRPYQVLIWIAADQSDSRAASIGTALETSLRRDFYSLWRVTTADAPPAVAALMNRDVKSLSYDGVTASDPVLAIKKTHPEAVRLRTLDNVAEFVQTIHGADYLKQQLTQEASPSQADIAQRLAAKITAIPPKHTLASWWSDEASEAVITTRGLADGLKDPAAKLIAPPNPSLVASLIDQYDKVFFVRLRRNQPVPDVTVIEMDTLMRHLGAPATMELGNPATDGDTVVAAITEAFRPVVRIDEAGRKSVKGLARAGGLIVAPDSPARFREGDILEPMVRKDDRNGKPFSIGPLDWSFLVTTKASNRLVEMDFWSGRTGGLQGRKNDRTFRMGLRVRPKGRSSELRLHAKGEPALSLIGYEIYEKDLESSSMEFVGRTDWKGRLKIDPTENPFRLLYVKNGGAVLARLPIVPGLHANDIADLTGDDDRLQAEAYIKGVQNSIIDLVAIRELFKARIGMRLERGEMEKAEELMRGLQSQPSSGELNDAIGKRQTFFLKTIKNPSQRKKVDNMFSSTRDLLAQFINAKLVQQLEQDILTAKKNGGKLPRKRDEK